MKHQRGSAWLLLLLPSACGEPSAGEVGDTGEVGETGEVDEQIGPGGPGCDEWYVHDGPPAESVPVLPEQFDGDLQARARVMQLTGASSDEVLALAGPSPRPREPAQDLSYEQFIAQFATPWQGGWLIETDQFVTDSRLRALYGAYIDAAESPNQTTPASAVWSVDDIDSTWSGGRKLKLTWCVGRVFPTGGGMEDLNDQHYEQIVRYMERATRAWERAADVNFVHLREYDSPRSWSSGDCQPGEHGIYFRVRMDPGCRGPCMGLTNSTPETEFAPEWVSPENPEGWERELIIGFVPAQTSEHEAAVTTLHELGHILGFPHEHELYPQLQGDCESSPVPWRPLVPADPASVMGYDFCNGILPNQTRLSARDRLSGYYQYSWGHRRAKMMGPVSGLADYAYDGTPRAGISWFTPKSNKIDLWVSTASPGDPIEFDAEIRCLDGGPGPACGGGFDAAGRSRPMPLFGWGSARELDILLYGSGSQLSDILARNDGASLDPWLLPDDAHAIPIIGSFGSGINDQVLLYHPGPGDDVLLSFDDNGINVSSAPISDYAIPLAGRFQGFGAGGNNIIWYDPHSNSARVWWWWTWDELGYSDHGVSDLAGLGLLPGVEYVPMLGDFDGDVRTDIFWYAPGPAPDQLWISNSNDQYIIFDSYEHQVDGEYKPFVGDFDGNGVDDIFWYSVFDELEGALSSIWYFDEDADHTTGLYTVHRDYSPYVADFDQDGCSDILWFQPNDPMQQSRIWRCLGEDRDFACDPPVTHPSSAYPVGYGAAY